MFPNPKQWCAAMASFPRGSLPLVADGVLVRGIQMLRQAQTLLQKSGVGEDNPHLKEIEESLCWMEAEAERRGLSVPEEPLEAQQD